MSKEDNLEFLFLHQIKDDSITDLIEQAIILLNNQWKRSESARRKTFENASDNYPHFLFVCKDNKVIGYAKLSDCSLQEQGTMLIESLIVHPDERGKGYGKNIMNYCENYAKNNDFNVMGLSTKDKQGFYEYLGYIKTDKAITSLGNTSKFLQANQLSGLQRLFGGQGNTTNLNVTWYRKTLV